MRALHVSDANVAANVAVRKQAFQSSSFGNGTADKAVDGITTPSYKQNSCTHTKGKRFSG